MAAGSCGTGALSIARRTHALCAWASRLQTGLLREALDIPLELEYTGPVAFITGTLPPTADEAQVEGTLAEQAPESQVF